MNAAISVKSPFSHSALFGFITAPYDDMDPKREDTLGAQPQPRRGTLKRDAVRRKPGLLHRPGRRIAIVGTFKRVGFMGPSNDLGVQRRRPPRGNGQAYHDGVARSRGQRPRRREERLTIERMVKRVLRPLQRRVGRRALSPSRNSKGHNRNARIELSSS